MHFILEVILSSKTDNNITFIQQKRIKDIKQTEILNLRQYQYTNSRKRFLSIYVGFNKNATFHVNKELKIKLNFHNYFIVTIYINTGAQINYNQHFMTF